MTRYIAINDEIIGVKNEGGSQLWDAYMDGSHHPFAASAVDTIGTYRWILESHIPLRKIQARLNQTPSAINQFSFLDGPGSCSLNKGKNGSVVLVEEIILAEIIRSRYEEFVGKGESSVSEWPPLIVDCVSQHENVVSSILEQLLFDSERISSLEFHVLEVAEYVQRKVCFNLCFGLKCRPTCQSLAWSSGYDDCLTRSRSRVQFSMPTPFHIFHSVVPQVYPCIEADF
jgi:hypothetical protein